MKIRNGFVSNSSASSFVLNKSKMNSEQIDIMRKFFDSHNGKHENEYYENEYLFYGDTNWNGIDGNKEHICEVLEEIGSDWNDVCIKEGEEGEFYNLTVLPYPKTEEEKIMFISEYKKFTAPDEYGYGNTVFVMDENMVVEKLEDVFTKDELERFGVLL